MLDLHAATSPEAKTAIAAGAVAVLPVGALEQHGPHLPLATDTILAQGVASRVAGALGALLLPPIAYGETWTSEGFAGTLSLTPDTLRAVIIDLGRGLKGAGVRALVTVNGHFGNREPIVLAARTLLAADAFPVLHLDYPGLEHAAAAICTSKPAAPTFYHADEVETSMMLALAPELVRMDAAVAEYPEFPPLFGSVPLRLDSFDRSGVFGDPRAASAGKGEALIAAIVAESVRLARLFLDREGIVPGN